MVAHVYRVESAQQRVAGSGRVSLHEMAGKTSLLLASLISRYAHARRVPVLAIGNPVKLSLPLPLPPLHPRTSHRFSDIHLVLPQRRDVPRTWDKQPTPSQNLDNGRRKTPQTSSIFEEFRSKQHSRTTIPNILLEQEQHTSVGGISAFHNTPSSPVPDGRSWISKGA